MTRFISVRFGDLTVLAKTERCSLCNHHIGWDRATFAAADKPQYRYVLFKTSDGFHVCSKKFRDLAMAHGFTGIEFVPLENGYFVLKVARLVDYDLTTAKIVQEGWCPQCRNHRRCLKTRFSYLIAPEEAPIGDFEVVQSRIRWGTEVAGMTGIAQGPDLLAGDDAAQVIEAAKFRGVDIEPLGVGRR